MDPATVACFMASLSSRIINRQLDATSLTAMPGNEYPQWGYVSSLLQSLDVDDLLKILSKANGYADDLVIVVQASMKS